MKISSQATLSTKMSGIEKKKLEMANEKFNRQIGRRSKKDQMGKDEFLKLLTVQLSKQDPLSPMKNTEFIAQMAQFTSLEQIKNLNGEVGNLRKDFLSMQSLQLVGKTVSFFNEKEGDYKTDVVEKIDRKKNKVYVSGQYIDLKDIREVK